MQNNGNYLDIFYNGRIKNRYTIDDISKKIQNFIRKNKLKNWSCEVTNGIISIEFNDDISDTLELNLKDNKFEGFCRVSNTNLETLLDMFFEIKCIFTKFNIEDDFLICESYLNNKLIGIDLLKITEYEKNIIDNIYYNGDIDYKEFILQYFAYTLELFSWEELYVNLEAIDNKWFFDSKEKLYEEIFLYIIETWLYEVCNYKDYGRFCYLEFFNKNNAAEYLALNGIAFDMYAFCNGIEKLIFGNKYKNKKSFGIKDAKISKFYNEKITIILEEENDRYNQCVLAYRFLKTILKYTNFQVCNKNEELSNTSRKKYFKFTNGMAASIEETLKYILGQV